jgi:hypothetical protein
MAVNGDPDANSTRPPVQVSACSKVHSDWLVGFDSGKMMGRSYFDLGRVRGSGQRLQKGERPRLHTVCSSQEKPSSWRRSHPARHTYNSINHPTTRTLISAIALTMCSLKAPPIVDTPMSAVGRSSWMAVRRSAQ